MASQLRGNDLRALGFPEGRAIGLALAQLQRKEHKRLSQTEQLALLGRILAQPADYLTDLAWSHTAAALLPAPSRHIALVERKPYTTYGAEHIEPGAIHQMETAMKLPVTVAGALMADAHHGYGLPIGGVLATDNAVIPYAVGVDIGCFTGDTRVALADGRALSFIELVAEAAAGQVHYGFSVTADQQVVISELRAPRQTRLTTELVDITLDNGAHYQCTPDHRHFRRDGSQCRADELVPGTSLMPLYTKRAEEVPLPQKSYRDKRNKLAGYTVVLNPATEQYDYVHFLADDYNLRQGRYARAAGQVRHHIDFNKLNNRPDNIQRLDWAEHRRIHGQHAARLNALGVSGFKAARRQPPAFFARMASANRCRLHQDPAFAARRDIRAAATFRRYNQTAAFAEQTRQAGQRGTPYLVAKNQSPQGRARSAEVARIQYVCPVCQVAVTGGLGIVDYRKACPSAAPFQQLTNHRVAAVRRLAVPPTPVYCLTVDEHENFALAAGVFVHNCRMALSVFDLPPKYLAQRTQELRKLLLDHTRFGSGQGFERGKRLPHAVLDREEFWDIPFLKNKRDKAAEQVGTSGSGNHFVEFGIVDITEAENDLGVPVGQYLGVLSHSGSRGLGASVANHYTALAMEQCQLPGEAKHLAWLGLDTETGQEYWAAMNLAGDYASACHAQIHQRLAKALGERPIAKVENHHNFAWQERLADGRHVIVHRKGATPAGAGVFGIIPGSMTAPGFLVRGRGVAESLASASHGAGRLLSRTRAKSELGEAQVRKHLAEHGVELIGGGLDEAPMAYKDIRQVMASQQDLVDVLGSFTPKIVRMDGA